MGVGYGVAPIAPTTSYTTSSPAAAILDNMGYLQTGNLFAMSYLSTLTLSDWSNYDVVAKVKPIVDFLKDRFIVSQATFSLPAFEDRFKSSEAQNILSDLRSYTFEGLYKSDPERVAKYDYVGMKGLEKIAVAKDKLDTLTDSDEKTKLNNDIMLAQDAISAFFSKSASSFKNQILDHTSTQGILDIMQGWESITYQQFQPVASVIGDRRQMIISLAKP